MSVAISKLQVAIICYLLDGLGRCLKLFVSTDSKSSHESASQFGLPIFLYAKKTPKTIAKTVSRASVC